jgi:hypothetical protein
MGFIVTEESKIEMGDQSDATVKIRNGRRCTSVTSLLLTTQLVEELV